MEHEHRTSIVVGIAGGSASGKSTVVTELVRHLGPERTAVLRHDAYYHDLSHMPMERRVEVNVDHPDSLETDLLVRHVVKLVAGEPIEVPTYDYVSQTRGAGTLLQNPSAFVLVEGLMVLHDESLRRLMDLRVFVAATEEQRLARRIERDGRERGRDRDEVVDWHRRRVEPMHARFVEPTRSLADVVIEGGGHNREAIEAVARRIEALPSL